MSHNGHGNHSAGVGTYIVVWLALVAMTGITVAAAGLDFKYLSVVVALVIASFKAALVLDFFMHLKYEQKVFKLMLLVAFVTLAVIIGLTFADISYRTPVE